MRPVVPLLDGLVGRAAVEDRDEVHGLRVVEERLVVRGVQALPLAREPGQLLHEARVQALLDELVFEVVGDLVEVHPARIVDVLVGEPRPGDPDAVLLRPFPVGAEPLDPDLAHGLGRLEVQDRGDQVELPAVVLVALFREAQQDVPGEVDVVVEAPL